MNFFEKSYNRVAKAPRLPWLIIRSGVPEQLRLMEAIYLNANNKDIWDSFAEKSDSAWFRHTLDWLDYSSCCRFDSNTKNMSFMVSQNKKIYAIVPLLVEYNYLDKSVNSLSMYGDYTPMPAFINDCEIEKSKILNFIISEINHIIDINNVKTGKFFIDPLITSDYFHDYEAFNLIEFGAQPQFTTANIVDLRQNYDVILRKMRKGHKAAIKQVWKYSGYKIIIFDNKNLTIDIFEKYKAIHFFDAGRQTRTDESWQYMYKWIADGKGCLAMLWLDEINDYIAGALVMIYKKAAYYASFATKDSYCLNGHSGYAIQWEIIKYLKESGIQLYETGSNYFDELNNLPPSKRAEISKYQRGYRTYETPHISYTVNFSKM